MRYHYKMEKNAVGGIGSYLTLINLDPGSTIRAGPEESSTVGSWHSWSGGRRTSRMLWPVGEHQGLGFLNSNAKPDLALARLRLSLCLKTLFVWSWCNFKQPAKESLWENSQARLHSPSQPQSNPPLPRCTFSQLPGQGAYMAPGQPKTAQPRGLILSLQGKRGTWGWWVGRITEHMNRWGGLAFPEHLIYADTALSILHTSFHLSLQQP